MSNPACCSRNTGSSHRRGAGSGAGPGSPDAAPGGITTVPRVGTHRFAHHCVSPEGMLNEPGRAALLAGPLAHVPSGVSAGRPASALGTRGRLHEVEAAPVPYDPAIWGSGVFKADSKRNPGPDRLIPLVRRGCSHRGLRDHYLPQWQPAHAGRRVRVLRMLHVACH